MKTSFKITLAATLIMALGACSSSKKTEGEQAGDEVPAATDAATDAVPQPTAENAQAPANPDAPPSSAEAAPQAPATETAQADSSTVPPSPAGSGQFDSYTVQAGDTLMKIAFETYGDLYRWKSLLDANKDKVTDPNRIPAGTVLKVEKPATPVTVEKNGEKYLIKNGDTLGSISGEVYGTQSKWKKLWENNKQMIHDPNRIFAGFYLYYQPEAGAPKDGTTNQAPMASASAAAPDTSRAPASAAPAQAAPPAGTPPAAQ